MGTQWEGRVGKRFVAQYRGSAMNANLGPILPRKRASRHRNASAAARVDRRIGHPPEGSGCGHAFTILQNRSAVRSTS